MLRVAGPLLILVAMLFVGGWGSGLGAQSGGDSAAAAPACTTTGLGTSGTTVAGAAASPTAGTPAPAMGLPSLDAFRVTVSPGAIVTSPPRPSGGQRSVYVQAGGPATFAFDGSATVVRPVGDPSTLPVNGGCVEIGPLSGIIIPPATGYELRNGGQEPLVLLWITADGLGVATSDDPVFDVPGVSITPLVPAGGDAVPSATPAA